MLSADPTEEQGDEEVRPQGEKEEGGKPACNLSTEEDAEAGGGTDFPAPSNFLPPIGGLYEQST